MAIFDSKPFKLPESIQCYKVLQYMLHWCKYQLYTNYNYKVSILHQ